MLPRFTSTVFLAVFLCGMLELSYNTESEEEEMAGLEDLTAALLADCRVNGLLISV